MTNFMSFDEYLKVDNFGLKMVFLKENRDKGVTHENLESEFVKNAHQEPEMKRLYERAKRNFEIEQEEFKKPLHVFFDTDKEKEYFLRGDLDEMLESGHIGNKSLRDDHNYDFCKANNGYCGKIS